VIKDEVRVVSSFKFSVETEIKSKKAKDGLSIVLRAKKCSVFSKEAEEKRKSGL